MPDSIRRGAVYGLLCFFAGFVLGTARELLLIPLLGGGLGRSIEFVLVSLAVVGIAVWQVAPNVGERSLGFWWAVGALGVGLLVLLESTLALLVLGQPIATYLASYDLSAGALLPVGLAVVLLAPVLVAAHSRRRRRR